MSKKTDFKICRYEKCGHANRTLDITKDAYKVEKSRYYHLDCFEKKKNREWKDEQANKDLQYIKNQWVLNIDNTVVYSRLFQCLNELLARGISSDYLVFVMDYVIKYKMKLRYPDGFKYYVSKQKIKDAYQKQLNTRNGVNNKANFVVTEDSSDAPKFSISQKPQGFQSIFGGKK